MTTYNIDNATLTATDGEGNTMTFVGVNVGMTVNPDGNIVKKPRPLSRQQRRAKDRAGWKALDREFANPQHPHGPRWMRRRKYKVRLRGLGVTR